MNLLICVDDTDDLTKETSTGKIADAIQDALVERGAEVVRGVTRHQLLLSDEIDYTSHNSSMCMELVTELPLEEVREIAERELRREMSAVSDPGLCFCVLEELRQPEKLITYGKRAQREVITKDEAYQLAAEIGGTGLYEYGGSGIGVIGALAGCGLRLFGSDGTFRGGKGSEFAGKQFTVREWKQLMGIEQVTDMDGQPLDEEAVIAMKDRIKLACLDHKKTLVVKQNNKGEYVACKKKDLYEGDRQIVSWRKPCEDFTEDNDLGECYSEGEVACWNCLYRRWTADGYECAK